MLGFNFTQKKVAPVLDLTDKTVTMNGEVKVKVIVLAIKSTGIYILVRWSKGRADVAMVSSLLLTLAKCDTHLVEATGRP